MLRKSVRSDAWWYYYCAISCLLALDLVWDHAHIGSWLLLTGTWIVLCIIQAVKRNAAP